MAKRRKTQRLLVELPEDILENVFVHVPLEDVKTLSLTCSAARARTVPYIMRLVKVTWAQLLELQKTPPPRPARFRHYVERLRIADANSYNEYQMQTFGELVARAVFPRIFSVTVNSVNSSNWLKYNACSHIRELRLCSDPGTASVKIFHLAHVEGLRALRIVTLHDYHFNWTDEPPPVALAELFLHDCTWEYPFTLASFNRGGSLRRLAVSYSRNNSFILLERFDDFLHNPFPLHPASLRDLSVGFVDVTVNKRLLSMRVMSHFLNHFPGLARLRLHGWTANIAYLAHVLRTRTYASPLCLTLALEPLDGASGAFLALDPPHNLALRVALSAHPDTGHENTQCNP